MRAWKVTLAIVADEDVPTIEKTGAAYLSESIAATVFFCRVFNVEYFSILVPRRRCRGYDLLLV